MTPKHFAAALGFAFAAAWIAFGFGNALLCLLSAGLFYGVALVLEGQIDLGELQDRVRSSSASTPSATSPPAFPTPRPGRRVQ